MRKRPGEEKYQALLKEAELHPGRAERFLKPETSQSNEVTMDGILFERAVALSAENTSEKMKEIVELVKALEELTFVGDR